MKLKVIRTGDMDCLMFPEGVTSLDEFVKKNISKDNMFIKMRILSDDAGTEPFFLKEDIKDIYVNFNNVSTLYEDEVFLLTVQEFEENLRPFTDEIWTSVRSSRCGAKPGSSFSFRRRRS